MITTGANVNKKYKEGRYSYIVCRTAIVCAARALFDQRVESLMKAGADVNIQDEKGNTTVMNIAFGGQDHCVDLLLTAGADMNKQNLYGITALMSAAECGYDECIEVLIKAGTEVNKQKEDGYTALMYAVEMDSHKCNKRLYRKAGWSSSTCHKFKNCVRLLLAAEADVNKFNIIVTMV